MKKYFIILILIASAFFANAQESLMYSTQPLNKSLEQVEAETSGGIIIIEGGHIADARLEIYVRRNNTSSGKRSLTKAEAQELIEENYNLNIEERGRTLQVSARHKHSADNRHNPLSISFKIFVPTKISTQLHSSGGSIGLTKVTGNQKFSTAGGGLKIDQVGGTVDGETAGGSIRLSNSKGNIKMHTAGGSLLVDNCEGTIHLETAGGGIKADNVQGELYAHTAGGNLHLEKMSCSLDAGTSGGNINVSVSALGKYVKLNTAGGNISLDLPQGKGMDLDLSASHVSAGELNTFHGEIKRDKIEGTLNGGGIPVEAKGTGNISVEFR